MQLQQQSKSDELLKSLDESLSKEKSKEIAAPEPAKIQQAKSDSLISDLESSLVEDHKKEDARIETAMSAVQSQHPIQDKYKINLLNNAVAATIGFFSGADIAQLMPNNDPNEPLGILNAPRLAIGAALETYGKYGPTSENIKRLYGPTGVSFTPPGSPLESAGEAVLAVSPMLKYKAIGPAIESTGVKNAIEGAYNNFKSFLTRDRGENAAQMYIAALGGAGGKLMENPDDPYSSLWGSGAGILGGMSTVGSLRMGASILSGAERLAGAFTEEGAMRLAARIIQNNTINKEQAASKIEGFKSPLPGARFTTMEMSEDSGLRMFQKGLTSMKQGNVAANILANRGKFEATARAEMESMVPEGNIGNTISYGNSQHAQRTQELNGALEVAKQKALLETEAMYGKLSMVDQPGTYNYNRFQEELSKKLRENFGQVMASASKAEKEVWQTVAGGETIATSRLTSAAKNVASFAEKRTNPANRADLFIDKILGPANKKGVRTGGIPATMTFDDLQVMKSELTQEMWAAKAANNNELAKQYSELLNGVMDTIESASTPENLAAFTKARAFTKAIHDRFDAGDLSKIYAKKDGRFALAPSEVFDTVFPSINQETMGAVKSIIKNYDGGADLEKTLIDSMRTKFLSAVTDKNGFLIPKNADKFKEQFSSVLEAYPQLKSEIDSMVASGENLRKLTESTKNELQQADDAFRLFIGDDPERALTTALLNPTSKETANMISQVAQDTTGAAMAGLRNRIFGNIFESAQRGERVTAPALNAALKKWTPILKKDFNGVRLADDATLERLNGIVKAFTLKDEVTRATSQMGSGTSFFKEFKERTPLEKIVFFSMRASGARLGAEVSSLTSAGQLISAGAGANLFEDFLHSLSQEKATAIIFKAIDDPELMKELLRKNLNPEQQAEAVKKMKAYLVSMNVNDNSEEQQQ